MSTSGATFDIIPSGPAGGDLAGFYPAPVLAAIAGGAIGPLGSTTRTPVVTRDAKGRVTALTDAAILAGLVTIGVNRLGLYGAPAVVQPAAVAAPAGGLVIDVQARTAIGQLIAVLSQTAGGIGVTA